MIFGKQPRKILQTDYKWKLETRFVLFGQADEIFFLQREHIGIERRLGARARQSRTERA
jgi:hypothetical protein